MMIEVICNDRLGKKVRVKCNHDDSIGDLKKLIAAQTGTKAEKIVLKKWCKYHAESLSPPETFRNHRGNSDEEGLERFSSIINERIDVKSAIVTRSSNPSIVEHVLFLLI